MSGAICCSGAGRAVPFPLAFCAATGYNSAKGEANKKVYGFFSLLSGVSIAVMVAVNGRLSAGAGTLATTVIIHAAGVLFALLCCALQKHKRPLWGHKPRWIYTGGAIGVFTTIFNCFAVGRISMTSIMALGLLGQTVTSLFVDTFGLLGMEKQPLRKHALIGLCFAAGGVCVMLDSSVSGALVPVVLVLLTGVTMVLSRTVNARLAAEVGGLRGSFINHLVGLPCALAFLFLLAPQEAGALVRPCAPAWAYVGGVMGVCVVMAQNILVPKISAFRLTLLSFLGQVFMGVALDVLAGNGFADATFTGGLLIAAGVAVNLILARVFAPKNA